MTQMRKVLLAFLCTLCFFISAQDRIKIYLTDAKTAEVLPNAHIIIKDRGIGISSSKKGVFYLDKEKYAEAKLQISYIGYASKEVSINSLQNEDTIALDAASYVLDEVVISPFSIRERIWRAIQKIPQNYMDTTYATEGYFVQELKEDSVGLNTYEGVFYAEYPKYTDTLEANFELKQLRVTKRSEQMKSFDKLLKKQKKKDIRKLKRKKASQEKIDSVLAGNPVIDIVDSSNILAGSQDIIRSVFREFKKREDFAKETKKYNFSYAGQSIYAGHKVDVIKIISKKEGEIVLYLDSADALLALYLDDDVKIPFLARMGIFFYGYSIREPKVSISIYYLPYKKRWKRWDRWYMAYADIDLSGYVKKNNWFAKDEEHFWELHYRILMNHTAIEEVEHKFMDKRKSLLLQAPKYDSAFWGKLPNPYSKRLSRFKPIKPNMKTFFCLVITLIAFSACNQSIKQVFEDTFSLEEWKK